MYPVIVSFYPGTSGRFISAICHMMQHNIHEEIKWIDNSAHNYTRFNETYWKDAPDYFAKEPQFLNTRLVYKYLDLEPNKIMPTHAYPEFNLIKEKSPNCKIIIISCDKHNFSEIAFNLILKNKSLLSKDHHENLLNTNTRKYRSIIIPDEYIADTQVIMYDEIYKPIDNTYVGLEKISKFLGLEYNNIILSNYKSYVEGRQEMLRKNDIAFI